MLVSLLLELHHALALGAIYKAATATKIAPIAPTNEPERTLAALVETVVGPDEVPVADPVAEVLILDGDPLPTGTVPLPPLTPVAVVVEPVAVAEAELIPLPAPSDGVSPEPEETTWPPVAAEERDEAALARDDVAEAAADDDDSELPCPPLTAVELEEGDLVEDWLLAELEETALQDKSYSGVVPYELPIIPKLGLGVAPLES
jgi:hypothetical protein